MSVGDLIDERLASHWMPKLVAAWRASGGGGQGEWLKAKEARRVADAVAALREGLTGARALYGSAYLDEPAALGAYLLYYWPISYAIAARLFAEIGAGGPIADLGAGPGPVACAALDAGATEAVLVEPSRRALKYGEPLVASCGRPVEAVRGDARAWEPGRADFDLVALGMSLGELWSEEEDAIERRASLLERAASWLAPGGAVAVIEPALRDSSRALLEVRDRLAARGLPIAAPCLRAGPCPALQSERDWCHQERAWRAPREVAAIATEAGTKRGYLKYSYLVVGRGGPPVDAREEGERVVRIVSGPLHAKGRFRYLGCGPQGRDPFVLLKRDVTKETKAFLELKRGDVVAIEGVAARGDGARLGPRSRVRVLRRAAGGD